MLNTISYKAYGYVFAVLLLSACTLAAWFSTPTLLLLPFGVLGCLWAMQNLQWLFVLLLITIPWSIEFNFTPSLGTDLPDEPIMLLTAFTTLAYCVINRKAFKKEYVHPLLFIIFLQLCWTIISVSFSTNALVSVKYLLAKSWYLLSFLIAPLFVFQNEKWIKRSVLLVALSMLVLVVITMVRHATNGFTFATINNSLEPFFRNHVNYSATLVFTIPIFWGAYHLADKKIVKRFFSISLFFLLTAVYFSYARGAWLALVVGVVAYWLLRKRALLFAFIVFLVIVFTSLFWLQKENNYLRFAHHYNTTIFHTNFEEHLVATYQLQDVSTAERFYRWIAGVRMIKDRWQTGYGPNTFYDNYKAYGVPAFKTWVSNNEDRSAVHNYFLLTFIEQGLMGFLLLLVLIGAFFWYAQKLYANTNDRFWKITIACTTIIFAMICTVNFLSDLVETDKVGSFFYLCIALLIIADFKTRKRTNS